MILFLFSLCEELLNIEFELHETLYFFPFMINKMRWEEVGVWVLFNRTR